MIDTIIIIVVVLFMIFITGPTIVDMIEDSLWEWKHMIWKIFK
jgi:hypothetical protein